MNFIAEFKILHSSFRFLNIGKRFYIRLSAFKLNSFVWHCSPWIFNALHQITKSIVKIFNTTSEFSFTLQWSLIKTICLGVGRGWLRGAWVGKHGGRVRTYCCTRNFGRLDSCQNGDYSGIFLRLEHLNRTIINCGDLPDSIVAGIGSAIACLLSAQRLSVPCIYRANRLLTAFTRRRGRPPFDVSEDQLVFLVDSGFTGPKISELLGIPKRTVEKEDVRLWNHDIGWARYSLFCPLLNSLLFLTWSEIVFKSSTIVAPTIFSIIEIDVVFQYFSHTTIIYEFLLNIFIIYSDFIFF